MQARKISRRVTEETCLRDFRQITERNSAKLPNKTQPNYRTKLGQITERHIKSA